MEQISNAKNMKNSIEINKRNESESKLLLIYIFLFILSLILWCIAICILSIKLFKRYKAKSYDREDNSFELSDNIRSYSFGYKMPPIQQQYRVSSVSSSIKRSES